MIFKANKKFIDISNIAHLLTNGEKNVDKIIFSIDRFYNGIDLADCNFMLRAVNESQNLVEQNLEKVISEFDVFLDWTIDEYFTAVDGELKIEIRGTLNDELIIKYSITPIYVKSSAIGQGLPQPNVVEKALDEINKILGEVKEISIKTPIIQSGTWWIFDDKIKTYVDTSITAKGEKGEAGERGADGQSGTNGLDGKDGFSPIITLSENTDTSCKLTIIDKNGTIETPSLLIANSNSEKINGLIDDINYRLLPGSSIIKTMSGVLYSNSRDSSVCSVDDKCYIFGGYDGNQTNHNYIQIYDTSTDICTKSSATMVKALSKACVCIMDKNVYIFGGQKDYGGCTYDDIQIYDTSTNIRTTSNIKMLESVSCSSATIIHDKFYIFGGNKSHNISQYTSKIEIYDPQTNTITFSKATLSSDGTGKYAVVYFKELYCINTDVYDPETDTVTTSNNPTPKGAKIICVNGTKYYSFIGANIYIFNANNNTNVVATSKIAVTDWYSACSAGNNCYIFGGNTGATSSSNTNTILRFKEDIINYI